MAEYTLTSGSETITGIGNDVDHFVGFAVPGFTTGVTGGFDALNGAGGADHFYLGAASGSPGGTVEGGADTDTVHAYGRLGGIVFTGCEVLDLASQDPLLLPRMTAAQVNSFTTLTGHVFASGMIALQLGINATVDFDLMVGPSATFGVETHITGIIANGSSSFTIAGTHNADRFVNQTSNNDTGVYDGGAGNDTFIADNSGGFDVYRGGTGDDFFDLDGDPSFGINGPKVASIDGGGGNLDLIEATNTGLDTIAITGVEVLRGSHISLTGSQIAQFNTFENATTPFLFLVGPGGTHDFTGRALNGLALDCAQATSGGSYTLSEFADFWFGSQQHDETVQGGLGGDTFSVTWVDPADTGDEVNGGDGDDTLVITSDLAAGSGNSSPLDAGPGSFVFDGEGGNNTISLNGTTGRITDASLSEVDFLEFLLATGQISQFEVMGFFLGGPPPPPPGNHSDAAANVPRVTLVLEGAGGTLDLTTKATTLDAGVGVEVNGAAATSAVTITGSTRSDRLVGTAFNDVLTGGQSDDELVGGAGNDTLSGGAGADESQGQNGLDAFRFNTGDAPAGETINGGADSDRILVASSTNLSLATILSIEEVEFDATVIAAKSAFFLASQFGTGVSLTAVIDGADIARQDVLNITLNVAALDLSGLTFQDWDSAGTENDLVSVSGNASDNAITGSVQRDVLNGNGGNDTINGHLGNDVMRGGIGNDTFIVDSAADQTVEISGEGTDTVRSTISVALQGNTLNNTITGNAQNNVINGLAGVDTMSGGNGNDTYFVETLGDSIIELAGAGTGTDTVRTVINFTLGANVEQLILDGTAGQGTGNSLANVIAGNASNNLISGKDGNDFLTGNAGQDTFFFDTTLNAATNVDRISDFTVVDDTIRLENAVFTGLANGALAATAFHVGAAATTAAHRIIYNAASGALSFDVDGAGGAAQVRFATLNAGLALTNADFFVV